MSKVFIVNNSVHDYSKATKHGELVNVTEGNIPIFKTDIVRDMLLEGLKDFKEDDYLLIVGPTLLCIMAVNIALSKVDFVKMLVFDARLQDYTVRGISK